MLHEHRVLTATQITDTAFPSYRSGRQRLRELYQWSVLDRFQPFATIGSTPMHYVLAPAGAAALAAAHGIDTRDLGYRHDRTLGVAHNLHLAHTVGVNEWFAALVTTARHNTARHETARPEATHSGPDTARGGRAALEVWWSQRRCARHFGDIVRPDGYGRWSTGGGRTEFFLEFDLGSEPLTRVAAKLAGYAALAAATGIVTPLLVWFPTSRREAGARTALLQAWRDVERPDTVPVATAAAGLLDPRPVTDNGTRPSPADPVWLPLTVTGGTRLPLHQLTEAWRHLDPNASSQPAGADLDASGVAAARNGATLLPAPFPMPPPPSTRRAGTSR